MTWEKAASPMPMLPGDIGITLIIWTTILEIKLLKKLGYWLRISNDIKDEFLEAKTQVKKIATFRLNEIMNNSYN